MFFILIIIGLISLVYLYLIKPFQHWKRLQVPQYSVAKVYKGIINSLFPVQSIVLTIKSVYQDFPNARYIGTYQFISPTLYIRDAELFQQISIKDFDYFTDHMSYLSEETEPFWSRNLLALKGENWRKMRAVLSPSFTSRKLKTIYPLIINCAKQLTNFFENVNKAIANVDMKEITKRLACDVIATSAFGISRNSFEDPNNDFYIMGSSLLKNTTTASFKLMFSMIFPKLSNILNIRVINPDVIEYFENIIVENIKARETKGIYRPDMIQLLVDAKKNSMKNEKEADEDENEVFKVVREKYNKVEKIQLTDEDIFSQAFLFFFAGFETVSVTMSFMAYYLAINPDIQKKLFEEIQENIRTFGVDPDYENLIKMKYLDMVVSETLRLAPINPFLERVCTKPYTIQPKNADERPVHLKVGSHLLIPLHALHTNPKYFSNPDRFDPERFSDENKANIVSGSYIAFGNGPRSCIGSRFALIETKLAFYYILSKFEIVVTDETPIPLKLGKSQIATEIDGGVWVGLKKRKI